MSEIEISRSWLCSYRCFLEFKPCHKEIQFLGMSHTTKWKQGGKKVIVNDNSEATWNAPSAGNETGLPVQLHSTNLSHLFSYFLRTENSTQIMLLDYMISYCSILVTWNSGSSEQKTRDFNHYREMDSSRGRLKQTKLGSCITSSAGLRSFTLKRRTTWTLQSPAVLIPSQASRLPTEYAGNTTW